jgi:hypothetical protein
MDDPWPNRAQRYRREAERLRAEAEKVPDPYTRQQLLNVARQYERLATSIERLPLDRGCCGGGPPALARPENPAARPAR